MATDHNRATATRPSMIVISSADIGTLLDTFRRERDAHAPLCARGQHEAAESTSGGRHFCRHCGFWLEGERRLLHILATGLALAAVIAFFAAWWTAITLDFPA